MTQANVVKRYTAEFREGAVRLVLEHGDTPIQASERLGISIWSIRDWVCVGSA